MSITLEQAKQLKPGTILYHMKHRNADGSPQRWRVSGQPKTWKRQPERVEVPVKHGLRTHDRLNESSLFLVALTEEDALKFD